MSGVPYSFEYLYEGVPFQFALAGGYVWAQVDANFASLSTGMVTPYMFGAVGDGVTDDTAAFNRALAASNLVIAAGTFKIGDVTIGTGKAIDASGGYFNSITGSASVFKLTGVSPRLNGGYILDGMKCSRVSVLIDNAQRPVVNGLRVVNSVNGIELAATVPATGCAGAQISNVWINTFTGVGFNMGPNVLESSLSLVYIDPGLISGTGGLIPRTGATGFQHIGTGSVVAKGGHRLFGVTAINCQNGMRFVDSTLSTMVGCVADSNSGFGVSVEGASDYLDFEGQFCGTNGRGVQVSQTSSKITFTGLRTILQGVIPPGGGTNYFSSAGFSAPFLDVGLLDFCSATIDADSWWGDKNVTAVSGTTLNLTGGERRAYCSNGTVAAAATVFFGVSGEATATETVFVAPFDGSIFTMTNVVAAAPGVGKNFTYTLRKNGADTALVGTINGAATSSSLTGGPISFSRGDTLSIKLVTDAASTVTTHRGLLQLLPNNN